MRMWRTTCEGDLDEKEKAVLMVRALEKMNPKPNDIVGMIKREFGLNGS